VQDVFFNDGSNALVICCGETKTPSPDPPEWWLQDGSDHQSFSGSLKGTQKNEYKRKKLFAFFIKRI